MSDDWNDNEMWESAMQQAERLDEEEFNHGDLYESIDIEGKRE